MVDRSKLSQVETAMLDKVMSYGISEQDAELIADSILSRKTCSWINNDEISPHNIKALNDFLLENKSPVYVLVSPVSTRNKFMWEVKLRKQ